MQNKKELLLSNKTKKVHLYKCERINNGPQFILGDPGADSGDEGKSKRAEKYGTKKSNERREEAPGENVLPDEFQTVAAIWNLIGARKKFSGTNQKPERRRSFGTRLAAIMN